MENYFFFFKNKERAKFFLKCVLIGMPILLLLAWGVNRYEDSEAEKGTVNDKGGYDYAYREGAGAKTYPEPVAKLVEMYPNSQTTYINVSTDKNNELEGNMLVFTPDDLGKVIAFYKQKGRMISEEKERLEIEKNGQNITISKEKVYEDDPIQGETKFEIRFNTKASVEKWKNFKP